MGHYFLWEGQILYLGRGGISSLHRHHMLQLGFSLDRPIRVRGSQTGAYDEYQGVVIDSDLPHRVVVTSRQPVLFLWLDPESRMARRIRGRYVDAARPAALPNPVMQALRPLLLEQASRELDCAGARHLADTVLQTLAPDEAAPPLDDRIETVIRLLREHAPGRPLSVDALAEAVYLSSGRLMHLFSEQLGLPIRRYALWQRMLHALRAMAGGALLTEAAHAAGFSDSAHLTRTFRSMFGITPSALFKNSRFIQAMPCYTS